MTPGPTAAEQLVAYLERRGVRHVFGLCGHTNIAVLAAMADSDIDFVNVRHEQVAAGREQGLVDVEPGPLAGVARRDHHRRGCHPVDQGPGRGLDRGPPDDVAVVGRGGSVDDERVPARAGDAPDAGVGAAAHADR